MPTPKPLPPDVARALADRLLATTPETTDELISEIARRLPQFLAAGQGLREVFTAMAATARTELLESLAKGELQDVAPAAPEASVFAHLAAQTDITIDVLSQAFLLAQRIFVRRSTAELSALVTPEELVRYLPSLLEVGLTFGEMSYREAARVFAAARAATAQRAGAGLLRRTMAVLDGTVAEAALATRMLKYPVAGHHVCLVASLADGVPVSDATLQEAEFALRRVTGVRSALVVPADEATVWVWAETAATPDLSSWSDNLTNTIGPRAQVGLSEPGQGLAGFRETAAQARAAHAVLVQATQRHDTVVRYSQVSAISFLVDEPTRAADWVRATLGRLAEPGPDRERARSTLRAFLASGDNATQVAEQMFVHRNTVKYRVANAISLLPGGLDGHRLDISLALDYLAWVPLPE